MPIEELNALVRVGYVETDIGRVDVHIVVESDRTGRVMLSVNDRRARRRGEAVMLTAEQLAELRRVIDHIDAVADQLRGGGRIDGLARGPYR